MKPEISLFHLTMIGFAAVGGLMAGTSLAVKKTLSSGQARLALFLGYGVIGITFGVAAVAVGSFLPVFEVETIRGALLLGLSFGTVGVLVMAAANIGAVITMHFYGLRVTIEPESPNQDRRSGDE